MTNASRPNDSSARGFLTAGVIILIGAAALLVGDRETDPGPPSDASTVTPLAAFDETFTPVGDAIGEGGLPKRVRHEPTGIVLIQVGPGAYLRGSPETEQFHQKNEERHEVFVRTPFYLAETELTVGQWRRVMGETPLEQEGDDLPVSGVSWHRAQDLLDALNAMSGGGWRLPTEVEWEFACRAGTTTPFSFGERIDHTLANMHGEHPYPDGPRGEFRGGPIAVKSFAPNPWGFYDMHGNLWEWCSDLYVAHPELGETAKDVPGASRVIRGGGFAAHGKRSRAGYRDGYPPSSPGEKYGVRLALSVGD